MPVSCDFWVHDEGVDGMESYPKDYEIASSALPEDKTVTKGIWTRNFLLGD